MVTLFSMTFGLSIICSFIALFYTAIVRSWQSFLALGIASLPLSLYLFSGEPTIQYVGSFSFICFAISLFIFWREKRKPII
ncbi:hypothetical protein [Paenisporosarcina quisquiliarum]|uniref:hypothetical protein n=1 Tax=Paenisporosarcina quisquiliarum TaxID=365346 RepID=UPI0037357CB0